MSTFLEEAYARFMELPNHGPEVLPNVHPYRGAAGDLEPRGPPRPTGSSARPAGISAICPAP